MATLRTHILQTLDVATIRKSDRNDNLLTTLFQPNMAMAVKIAGP